MKYQYFVHEQPNSKNYGIQKYNHNMAKIEETCPRSKMRRKLEYEKASMTGDSEGDAGGGPRPATPGIPTPPASGLYSRRSLSGGGLRGRFWDEEPWPPEVELDDRSE